MNNQSTPDNDVIMTSSAIKTRLQTTGIHTVMVIDNVLDDNAEKWRNLLSEDRSRFWDFIDEHAELQQWLESEGLMPPKSTSAVEAEGYLEILKGRLSDNEDLLELWNEIVMPGIGDARKEIDELIQHLKDLDVVVLPAGISVPAAPPDNLSVIFIDYRLDETEEKDPAAAAVNEINRIYNLIESPHKPIVVLMSNRRPITPADEVEFRSRTNIMPGMFFRFGKAALKGISLHLILSDIAEHWKKAIALDSFVKAISTACHEAAGRVSELVQELTLEDFALIQLLSLNDDGHPLGDYVLWLADAYFRRSLEDSEYIGVAKPDIDRLVFTSPPMTEWGPSGAFLKAYRAALFADASPELASSAYPMLDEKASQLSGSAEDMVVLHFGDVFIREREGSPPVAYVVLTPECDLVFGGSRAFPRNRSVILLPGDMNDEEPFKSQDHAAPRTELLAWNGKDWRIQWKVKESVSIRLGDFRKWTESMKLTRVAKMDFMFASEIQHSFIGNLIRVGLPVVPPQFHPQTARICVQGWNKKPVVVGAPIQEGAYIVASPHLTQRKCILSDYVLVELQRSLPQAIEIAEQMPHDTELNNVPEERLDALKVAAQERTEGNAATLAKLSTDLDEIMRLKGPHDLDLNNEKELSYVTITGKASFLEAHTRTVLAIHLEASGEGDRVGTTGSEQSE